MLLADAIDDGTKLVPAESEIAKGLHGKYCLFEAQRVRPGDLGAVCVSGVRLLGSFLSGVCLCGPCLSGDFPGACGDRSRNCRESCFGRCALHVQLIWGRDSFDLHAAFLPEVHDSIEAGVL